METNDRIEQVKDLLHRYRRTAVYIKNLKEEIADKKAQIEAMPAPKVPGYSPTPGGGANNLSPEERAYFANERALERITELQCRINELEPILLRVDRTLDALTVTDRNIIVSRCINHYPWNMTAGAFLKHNVERTGDKHGKLVCTGRSKNPPDER